MYYAVADIHGCYDKFKRLLDIISFSNEKDVLFVVGDAVDRGKDGIKVLQLMMQYDHIVPIMGNHDRMAYEILIQFEEKIIAGSEKIRLRHLKGVLPICGYWFSQGGMPTLKGYTKLKKKERIELLKYMGDFLPLFELEVNGKRFALLHAGIPDFDKERSLWDYPTDSFLYERMDYDRKYFDDVYIISGHTPTDVIDKEYEGRILKKNNHIAIDCGAYCGKPLGCICLDTLEEFYSI